MKKSKHLIKEVEVGSIAEELEIESKDYLVSINGVMLEDIFDYQFMIQEEYLEVLIEKQNGEEWLLEIEKEEDEDLGIVFENGLMDDYRSCHNKCIFCFIDQMPKGMRETLYFKDDDSRLSFLQGNYVTLTNMSEADIERIIKYHLSPINISFQTMNKELRCKMLNNRFAGDALAKVDRLFEAGITMNGQIVLCKGVNDKAELDYSIGEMMKYLPNLESVSVVPVGISKFRDGLYPLEPFDKADAKEVLETIHKWQKKAWDEYETHFIHASDEWYILAEEPIPLADNYDGYLQYENGVGMVRLLIDEYNEALLPYKKKVQKRKERTISIATGALVYPIIKGMAQVAEETFSGLKIHVYEIKNHFFGEHITVSGLLTGQDIKAQLAGKELGEKLLLPQNVLRSGERVFLDDMMLDELENALQVRVDIVKSSGCDFLNSLITEEFR